jgi:hypothetical protein
VYAEVLGREPKPWMRRGFRPKDAAAVAKYRRATMTYGDTKEQVMLNELDELKKSHPELVTTFGEFIQSYAKFQQMEQQFKQVSDESVSAKAGTKFVA